jgi:hypothetical protein
VGVRLTYLQGYHDRAMGRVRDQLASALEALYTHDDAEGRLLLKLSYAENALAQVRPHN